MINISVLVPDIAVKTFFIEDTEQFITEYDKHHAAALAPYIFFGDIEDGYQIVYNVECIDKIYQDSWLHRYVGIEVLYEGFLIKELAQLRYSVKRDTFDETFQKHILRYKKSGLYGAVFDILFSALIEYQLKLEFPELAKRLELLYSGVFYRETQRLESDNIPLMPYLVALENLVRFNSITTDISASFLSFCLPLALVAKRTDYANVIRVVTLIEEWLLGAAAVILETTAVDSKASLGNKSKLYSKEIRAITDVDLEEIDRNSRLVSVKSKIESVAKDVGLQAGTGNYPVKANNSSMFFLDTIRKYKREISELEHLFKKTFTSMLILDSFDGDVNMKHQQQAYLCSMTMEDGKVYKYYRKKKVSVDLMLLRDVSGSTYLFENEYAEGIVMILAAVNGFKGIRTLEIDFGGEVNINKRFDQPLELASIFPRSGGGSSILPAINQLRDVKLQGKRRLLFILSDGELNDKTRAEAELMDFANSNNVQVFRISLGVFANNGYERVNVRALPKYIAKKVIEMGEA